MNNERTIPRIRQSITVEFLSIPGAGKSTLSHRVAELWRAEDGEVAEPTYTLDHRRRPLMRKITKGLLAAGMLLRHPGQALDWISRIARTRQRSWHELCHVSFNWLYISGLQGARRSDRELRLLDEGIFQALWSIAYRAETWESFSTECPQWLSTVLPLPMVLVVVNAGTETVAQRLRGRSERSSLLEQDEERDGEYSLEHAQACLSCIEDLAWQYACRGGMESRMLILSVDNSSVDALTTAAEHIKYEVHKLIAIPT